MASSDSLAAARHHVIKAGAETVHWGYFSRLLKPVLSVKSGELVTIETLTDHAYDDHARMIAGDPGAESVFGWTKKAKNVDRRGAGPIDASIHGRGAGEGFGVHIRTGPIFVEDAEPGDVLEVRILDVRPRGCANPQFAGRAFGSNAAAWWGFHYHDLLTEPKPREVITIYEIDASAAMYYPVAVPGALLSIGDPHASQGDSELCGTAIECSLTGTFQLILHKANRLAGTALADLHYPLLETADEWVVHGFSFANYVAELGDKAQSEIFRKSSLDLAMRDAFRKMRHFLMTTKGLSEDETISLMSVAVDFGVTQAVDANWGIHAILKKAIFGDAG